MAVVTQKYPRLPNSDLLDDSKLKPHRSKIAPEKLKNIILSAIQTANKKSTKAILDVPEMTSEEEIQQLYMREGRNLFEYFRQYYSDPASAAFQCLDISCREVAKEQFLRRMLQKERMNSGWRYQYIAKDSANASQRFESVSDIGQTEADFNAVIKRVDSDSKLTIYVSVKNRSNTIGGPDWPKAIATLEDVASKDKNRDGDYICVFGITIERGERRIRGSGKTKKPFSVNTELWLADFFWPFFTNYTYEDIAKAVLEVLISQDKPELSSDLEMPEELLASFEDCCREHDLLDEEGKFNDAFKLVEFFCRPRRLDKKKVVKKKADKNEGE
jgi:hypothetical protein